MTRRLASAAASLWVAVALSGALPVAAQDAEPGPPGPPAATPIAEPPSEPSGDGTGVRLATQKGDIIIGLFTESAPVASENFVNLVAAGYYDGLTFHRLVPGFVIQGGDPNGDGTGGPGYNISDEPVVGRYGRGLVAMARTQAPGSQGSQFFIVLDDEAEGALEHYRTYSIFGRVVEGMEVVDAIAAMPNAGAPTNRALEPVAITRATLEGVELPPEPERPPLTPPGPAGDTELEARIPASVAGQPMAVISFTGQELAAGAGQDEPIAELVALIESAGGTMDGFSMASGQGQIEQGFVGIIAARLIGADAALLLDRLPGLVLGHAGGESSTVTVAGREVTVLTPYPGATAAESLHVFADGDVLWMVMAPEPHLSAIVGEVGS